MEKTEKGTINFRQGIACIALFFLGDAVVTGGNRSAGRDTWLVILGLTILTILLGLLYTRILRLFPEKSLFEILRYVFGRAFGNTLIFLMMIYFMVAYAVLIVDFGIYTSAGFLITTPSFFIALPVMLLSYYLTRKGIQVIGRVSIFLFACVLLYYAVNLFFTRGYFLYENLLPIMDRPASDIAQSAVGLLAFPFAESVVFLPILHKMRRGTNIYKVFATGVALGGILFAYTAFQNVIMIGEDLYMGNQYPTFLALGLVTLGDYVQHVEIIVSLAILFCVFIKCTVCLYNVQRGFLSVFPVKKPKWIFLGVAAAAIVIAQLFLPSPQSRSVFAEIYPYFALPIQVGLPCVIWIAAELKKRKENRPAMAR